MILPFSPRRKGISLIETLVVVGIVLVLAGIALPAVQRVREAAFQVQCKNNLHQLALAVHNFHAVHGSMPPYWDSYPTPSTLSVKGCWYVHLLPYIEQDAFYRELVSNIGQTGSNYSGYTVPGWGKLIPGTPGYWSPPHKYIIDNPGTWVYKEVKENNGHSVWKWILVGQTGHYEPPNSVFIPGTPAHWEPPGSGPKTVSKPGGIFMPGANLVKFAGLQCPSDPSHGSYPDAGDGEVYVAQKKSWGSTNYLANWQAWGGDAKLGYQSHAQPFSSITDGLANTVLFAEGYSWCDGKGRIALNSWDTHSFGITWALPNSDVIDEDGFLKKVNFPNGMPNTFLFQVRPLAKEFEDCPDGADCCNNWAAQTGHVAMNVALGDGGVRSVAADISRKIWKEAMLPRDGQALELDW